MVTQDKYKQRYMKKAFDISLGYSASCPFSDRLFGKISGIRPAIKISFWLWPDIHYHA